MLRSVTTFLPVCCSKASRATLATEPPREAADWIGKAREEHDRKTAEYSESITRIKTNLAALKRHKRSLTYDKTAHTITEKQSEGKKTYTFEEYDEVVQERKQTDFFEPYVFDIR